MLLAIFLVVVFLVVTVGLIVLHSFWGNILTFFNFMFAAMLATGLFQPLTLLAAGETGAAVLDVLFLWLLFIAFFFTFRLITDLSWRYQVKFDGVTEALGRGTMALLTGWMFTCFAAMSLHVAPVGAEPFGGAMKSQNARTMLVVSPDVQWLDFMEMTSDGSFAGTKIDTDLQFRAKYYRWRKLKE